MLKAFGCHVNTNTISPQVCRKIARETLLSHPYTAITVAIRRFSIRWFAKLRLVALAIPWFSPIHLQAFDKAPDVWSYRSKLTTSSLLVDITETGGRIYACGERGHIIYSDDDGDNWSQAHVPSRQMITGIDFPTPNKGWAVGHDGNIYYSEDGGVNWVMQVDGLARKAQANRQYLHRLGQELKEKTIVYASIQQKFSHNENQTKSRLALQLKQLQFDIEQMQDDIQYYEQQFMSVVEVPWLDVWFSNSNHGIAVGAFGRAMLTEDGGKTWQSIKNAFSNPDEYHLNAIEGTDTGRLIVTGEAGTVYRSNDFGKTWETLNSPFEGSFFGAAIQPETQTVLIFGIAGGVYRSNNYGDSWLPFNVDIPHSLNGGIFTRSRGITIVGVGGHVLTRKNHNEALTVSTLPNRQHLNKVIETHTGRQIAVGQGGVHILPVQHKRLSQ